MSLETFSRHWSVYVSNKGDNFYTNVWYDTKEGAERAVKRMYPHADIVLAESAE